jgi:DNA-directed RNA polymerase subunit beta'
MGIHIPISLKTQAEARALLISSNNCALPSTGEPNLISSQDMVIGCYFLTVEDTRLFYIFKKIVC